MLKALSPQDAPVLITRPEFMRRWKEMQALQSQQFGMDFDSYNLVVNTNHPLIADKMLKLAEGEARTDFAKYLYDLALLNQGMLKGKDLSNFIQKALLFVA